MLNFESLDEKTITVVVVEVKLKSYNGLIDEPDFNIESTYDNFCRIVTFHYSSNKEKEKTNQVTHPNISVIVFPISQSIYLPTNEPFYFIINIVFPIQLRHHK